MTAKVFFLAVLGAAIAAAAAMLILKSMGIGYSGLIGGGIGGGVGALIACRSGKA